MAFESADATNRATTTLRSISVTKAVLGTLCAADLYAFKKPQGASGLSAGMRNMNTRTHWNTSSLYMKYGDHLSKVGCVVVGEKKGQDVFDIELVDPALR